MPRRKAARRRCRGERWRLGNQRGSVRDIMDDGARCYEPATGRTAPETIPAHSFSAGRPLHKCKAGNSRIKTLDRVLVLPMASGTLGDESINSNVMMQRGPVTPGLHPLAPQR